MPIFGYYPYSMSVKNKIWQSNLVKDLQTLKGLGSKGFILTFNLLCEVRPFRVKIVSYMVEWLTLKGFETLSGWVDGAFSLQYTQYPVRVWFSEAHRNAYQGGSNNPDRVKSIELNNGPVVPLFDKPCQGRNVNEGLPTSALFSLNRTYHLNLRPL